MLREDLPEKILENRNKLLSRFFTRNGYDVRLVGDKQKPSVILNEMVVLSCYTKHFELVFTKEPLGSAIIKTFNLREDNSSSEREIQEIIEIGTHRHVYKLKLVGQKLFLIGFNFKNKELALGRYPIFGKHHPMVFFDRAYAEKLVEGLHDEGYLLDIK